MEASIKFHFCNVFSMCVIAISQSEGIGRILQFNNIFNKECLLISPLQNSDLVYVVFLISNIQIICLGAPHLDQLCYKYEEGKQQSQAFF